MHKLGIVIGRFQPVTDFHVNEIFKPAIEQSDFVLVILGSSYRAPTPYDPFGHVEGEIEDACRDIELSEFKLAFRAARDYWYSQTKWLTEVQTVVEDYIRYNLRGEETEITLYGTEGGQYSFFDQFPQWNTSISSAKPPEFDILANFYEGQLEWKKYVSNTNVQNRMINWLSTEDGRRILEEYHYIEKYKAATQTGKYPIVFQTVDNIVVYKGNILLVQRRSKPGKGLWALPGGFLDANETLLKSAVRELREETKLKVKLEWLISQETFDAPQRSLRGRTITRAFIWKIPDWRDVPQVKASSDAAKARWFPIAEVRNMSNQLFEDHLDIIEEMIGRL